MTTKALQLVNKALPAATDGLSSYLQRVNAAPLLTAEEEQALALRYREHGDLLAAQQLVLAHLRYVVRIARMYSGYGLPVADLIQEGTIGLMKAVKRFDPTMGVRLVSFAVHWIKSEMHEFIIRNWRIVKMATTKAQRKLFFNLRQTKKRLGWFSAAEVKKVAEDLGVSARDVMEMEMRLNAHDDSFNITPNEDDHHAHPAHYLPAPLEQEPSYAVSKDNWQNNAQDTLQAALAILDERSLDIISQRWLAEQKTSLKLLAEKYHISIERVRQLENVAMGKLRDAMSADWVAQ